MNDKIVKIEFNIWANNDAEGEALKKAICDFIDWHGQRGSKVSANKLTDALNRWQSNILVKNSIIKHFKN